MFENLSVTLHSVASVVHGHQGQAEVSHAMVLDIFDADNDMWIFKNTYDQEGQPKQFQIGRTDPNAPEELFFVHIEVKNMANLPGQEEREANYEEKEAVQRALFEAEQSRKRKANDAEMVETKRMKK